MAGQSGSPCDRLKVGLPNSYSGEQAQTDFQRARQLNAPDSLHQKAMLLYAVYLFDATNHIGQLAEKELLQITETRTTQIQSQLPGTWHWMASMNWELETPESCECNRYMIISKDSIAYFRNGVPEKQEAYQLQLKPWFLGKEQFLIQTEGQCWLVKIAKDPATDFSRGTPGATLFLDVNDGYGMGCGSTSHDYEKPFLH
ncbi:MAG: hypothetical protein HUU01_12210 [Saprospiraceae bacterium]|nr:hypothetical protein [Saprospiraceae bacterium]